MQNIDLNGMAVAKNLLQASKERLEAFKRIEFKEMIKQAEKMLLELEEMYAMEYVKASLR